MFHNSSECSTVLAYNEFREKLSYDAQFLAALLQSQIILTMNLKVVRLYTRLIEICICKCYNAHILIFQIIKRLMIFRKTDGDGIIFLKLPCELQDC